MRPKRFRAIRQMTRIAPLIPLALFVVSCDSGQIEQPPIPTDAVVWTRLTDPNQLENPQYPDWRDSTIVFQWRLALSPTFVLQHIGKVKEDGTDGFQWSEAGQTLDERPRWVNDSLIVYDSNIGSGGGNSTNYDICYRDLASGTRRVLATTPSRESGPAPRPGLPALAYTEGANPFLGRIVLLPDTAVVPFDKVYLTPDTLQAGEADWDPSGNRLCFAATNPDGSRHVWIMTLSGNSVVSMREVTTGKIHDLFPRWSPDGTKIAFTSDRTGRWGVWWIDPDAGGEPKLIAFDDTGAIPGMPCWSPDGTRICVSSSGRGAIALWILSNITF